MTKHYLIKNIFNIPRRVHCTDNGGIRPGNDSNGIGAPVSITSRQNGAIATTPLPPISASGEVNESFDDADMNANGVSKGGPAIIVSDLTKEAKEDIRHATILDPAGKRDRVRTFGSATDRGGFSDFTEKRKLSRKHYSTVSKTSIFVNMRSKHVSFKWFY